MPSPEIQAYLVAREVYRKVMTQEGVTKLHAVSAKAWHNASKALAECEPDGLPPWPHSPWLCRKEKEDEYVWKPLLVEEHDGDEEAAQVAWFLGERPAGYPFGLALLSGGDGE